MAAAVGTGQMPGVKRALNLGETVRFPVSLRSENKVWLDQSSGRDRESFWKRVDGDCGEPEVAGQGEFAGPDLLALQSASSLPTVSPGQKV